MVNGAVVRRAREEEEEARQETWKREERGRDTRESRIQSGEGEGERERRKRE